MKWIETRVIFEASDISLATDLISDLFYDLGLQGVVVESREEDLTEDWAQEVQKGADHDAVIGYIADTGAETGADTGDVKARLNRIQEGLSRLEKSLNIRTRIVSKELDDGDWAHAWKQYFWPRKISERVVIKPTWREYTPGEGELLIHLDPGMAFGTGTHPTTMLCIRMIEKYVKSGDHLLDVGTGSGILMIAGALLGAETVHGVDSDPVAVQVAGENLARNKIPPERFTLKAGHLIDKVEGRFDIVAANILSDVIISLLSDLGRVCAEGGIFIGSGIIEANADPVAKEMAEQGIEVLEIVREAEWVAVVGRMNSGT